MRASEIRQLIRMKPVELDATRRRLGACHDIGDLRAMGRRLVPRPVFDYVDGGADEELSMAGNLEAFRRWRFQPRALPEITTVDTSARLLEHDLPFQLYIQRDRGMNKDLVDRAAAAGYRVLMVTVDTIVTGHRTRDRRNGLVIPPELTIQALASIASKPGYWVRMLRNDPIEFANFSGQRGFTIHRTGDLFNPAASWDDIAMLRDRWPGKLMLKGPISPSDARRAVSLGVDGLQLSNHGGRQLDRAVAPVDLIASVREAVGPEVSLVVDSGVRHGSDIAVALALGADACSIGRAYLYGLMAGGEPGIDKAIDILTDQFRRTLHLLGVRSAAELRAHGRELLVTP